MQRVADYKVINDSLTHIAANQSHDVNFSLSGAVAKAQDGQRPYVLITEKLGGAFPGTINIKLNNTLIDTRDGSANNILSGGTSYTHMVAFDGSLLNVGSSNTLTFEVSSATNTSLDLSLVILHFQRSV